MHSLPGFLQGVEEFAVDVALRRYVADPQHENPLVSSIESQSVFFCTRMTFGSVATPNLESVGLLNHGIARIGGCQLITDSENDLLGAHIHWCLVPEDDYSDVHVLAINSKSV